MDTSNVGFAVIYRWRIHAGMENQFRQAWETVTLGLKKERGALGSRLHLSAEGTWTAYAQWPDRGSWERSQELGPVEREVARQMQEAIAESMPPIILDPICDHLG